MGQKNSDLLGIRYLYHGTSAAAWQAIRRGGALLPRGEGSGNWSHTVRSHEAVIYLTSAYGLYFAACASRQGSEGVVLQIDVDTLEGPLLCCDEDAYALLDLKRANPGKSVNELAQSAKEALPVGLEYAAASLQVMGNCGYYGTIPLEAVTRAVAVDWSTNPQLAHAALEPVISPQAYRFMGAYYRRLAEWLFSPSVTAAVDNDPWTMGMQLPQSSEGVRSVWPEPSTDV